MSTVNNTNDKNRPSREQTELDSQNKQSVKSAAKNGGTGGQSGVNKNGSRPQSRTGGDTSKSNNGRGDEKPGENRGGEPANTTTNNGKIEPTSKNGGSGGESGINKNGSRPQSRTGVHPTNGTNANNGTVGNDRGDKISGENGGREPSNGAKSKNGEVESGDRNGSNVKNNGSRPQSRTGGKSSNGANSNNGANGPGNKNTGKNRGDKSGKISSQPGKNTGAGTKNGKQGENDNNTVGGVRDAERNGTAANAESGDTRSTQAAPAENRDSRGDTGTAAAEPSADDSGTASRPRADAQVDDDATNADDAKTASGNAGDRESAKTGKTSGQRKRASNSNLRASYNSSTGPYGEQVERVMESPRPRDAPRKAATNQRRRKEEVQKTKTPTPTPQSAPRSAKSRVVSEEDEGEKEPCEKCGVSRKLIQSEACEHRICKFCLPADVDHIAVDTDCPVCQRAFLYGEAPGRSDQPPLNRFHLVKDIYNAIKPPSCQRCEQTNQTTEVATCVCRDCAIYLCEPCADAHNAENFSEGKGWKNHRIFLLEEVKDKNELPPVQNGPSAADELFCPKHDDATATCYCQSCRRAYCAVCREEHEKDSHDFLNAAETKVYLREIVGQELRSTNYDVNTFDQFTDALRMKHERTEKELKTEKMEVMAKFNELMRALEKKRDGIVEELESHASGVTERGNFLQEAITDERRYADAMKKLIGLVKDGDDDVTGTGEDPDYRLLRIGEFVDQNEAALAETTISRDLITDVSNICKEQHDVKISTRKREEILSLIEDHAHIDISDDHWLNDEALLAKQYLRHSVDNTVCHVGAFRETELPYYQFLWPITEKYREYYGKETFILQDKTLHIEEGTTSDLIQNDIFKSGQFQVFVKAGSRLENTEIALFRNTECSQLFTKRTKTQSFSGLVTFNRNGVDKTMAVVSGSNVILAKDDRPVRWLNVGKGTKVAALDRSGNILIPFLIGKVVIRPQGADLEEVIHLRQEEHAVMYTFDKEREYIWTVDKADNVVKVYDYRKLAFLHGIRSVHD